MQLFNAAAARAIMGRSVVEPRLLASPGIKYDRVVIADHNNGRHPGWLVLTAPSTVH